MWSQDNFAVDTKTCFNTSVASHCRQLIWQIVVRCVHHVISRQSSIALRCYLVKRPINAVIVEQNVTSTSPRITSHHRLETGFLFAKQQNVKKGNSNCPLITETIRPDKCRMEGKTDSDNKTYTRWVIITGTPTKSGISLLLGHFYGYSLARLSPR